MEVINQTQAATSLPFNSEVIGCTKLAKSRILGQHMLLKDLGAMRPCSRNQTIIFGRKLVSEKYIAMVHSVKLHDDFPISR